MRILLATDSFAPNVGGISYATQRLARVLRGRGHDILVVAPARGLKTERRTHDGVDVVGLSSIPTYANGRSDRYRIAPAFLLKRTIDDVLSSFDPDIVHVQTHFFVGHAITAAAKERSIPLVGTNHFMPENLLHYFHLPAIPERAAAKWYSRRISTFFEQMDAVTTPTPTAAAFLRATGLTKDVLPISNGIDLSVFTPHGNDACRRVGFPETPILLSVGRLDPEKRVDVVIKAMPRILRRVQAHLVIAGTGAEEDDLRRLAAELDVDQHMTFAGFVPDEHLPALYRAASCFVTASIAELQSLVTMEAMASGLPITAVRKMALPELVDDGVNGFLFAEDDHDDLAVKAGRILADAQLRQSMSEQSLRIIAGHDVAKTAEAYESLYASLASTDTRRTGRGVAAFFSPKRPRRRLVPIAQ
jgi:1,2-diacylglycerol 3-alpha-glucosyltransferase